MRFIYFVIQVFLLITISSYYTYSQVIPDFEMTFKVINEFGEDSVIVGLSTNAGAGYDEGYDIIDTSEWQLPVDLRIYDPQAVTLLGDSCKHFTTSYLDFPNQNTYQIEEFEREFTLVLHINLEQINNWAQGFTCNDEQVLAGTYINFDLSPMYEYQFKNNMGFDFDLIDINPSGNVYLGGIDGINFNSWITPEAWCVTILAYDFSILPSCDIDIFFNVKLLIKNKLFVGVENIIKNPKITTYNNLIFIEDALTYKKYELFNFSGVLLKYQSINSNTITINIAKFNQKTLILKLSDPNKSNFLTHKIVNL